MPPRAPSISTLARDLGLARTTVSDALRGHGRVSPATVQRVRAAATAAGYKTNPLLATVLGAINHSRRSPVRGALALIDLYERAHWPHGPFQRELVAGARKRAAEMGFAVAEFVIGEDRLPWSRLESILRSRAIHGVIVLPAWFEPDLSPLDILVLHNINHRGKPKTMADICLVLNVEDTHVVSYALKKLERLKLIAGGRRGKEKLVMVTKAGEAACRRYGEVREAVLVSSVKALKFDEDHVHDMAALMRALSGQYDQAARSAASL